MKIQALLIAVLLVSQCSCGAFKWSYNTNFGSSTLSDETPNSANKFWVAAQAATDCNAVLNLDVSHPTDLAYDECLDQFCGQAYTDFFNTPTVGAYNLVPLSVNACYNTCKSIPVAGSNGAKHVACFKAGLAAAGVESVETVSQYALLGPVSLFYDKTQYTDLKFNTYGRVMRDTVRWCVYDGTAPNLLSEFTNAPAEANYLFHLVHKQKVAKIKTLCSSVAKPAAVGTDTLDLEAARTCLIEASRVSFKDDRAFLLCAADAARPSTAGDNGTGTAWIPGENDGSLSSSEKANFDKNAALYTTNWLGCVKPLATSAFNFYDLYGGITAGQKGVSRTTNWATGDVQAEASNEFLDLESTAIPKLHRTGYSVKHCLQSNVNCYFFQQQFTDKNNISKKNNVIQYLTDCENSCIKTHLPREGVTQTAPTVNQVAGPHNNGGQAIFSKILNDELAKYQKCFTDFRTEFVKVQRAIRSPATI